jgi:hypothetical protein
MVVISKQRPYLEPIPIYELCLSAVKVNYKLSIAVGIVPKNYREVRRLYNFKTY